MLREIRDLGFQYAELSHGIRVSLVPGIIAAVEEGVIRISTLHNFCPLPMGVNHPAPNLFKFSASSSCFCAAWAGRIRSPCPAGQCS